MINLPTWYDTGTVSVAGGGTTVTVVGGYWGDDAIMAGDLFCDPAQPLVPPQRVKEVTGDTTLELWAPWPGTAMTADPYEIRYVGIIERSTAQTRKVLEQLGEVSAYFDVQVDILTDRATYDSRPAGFRVLVSDIGDGRAAIYSKDTSNDADWSDPAYFSGPQGAQGDVGSVGINWRDVSWNSGTNYALNDGTVRNGSSWRSLEDGNLNHAPPNLPTTSNAWWALIAAKGADGSGTGDVVGPSAGVSDGDLVAFNGETGKLVKKAAGVTNAQLAAVATATVKGRATAGTGQPEDLTALQARALLGAPPAPSASTGAGQLLPLSSGAGGALTLPAGGAWAYFAFSYDSSSGFLIGGILSSVAAGGSTLAPATTSVGWFGWAWRLS